LVTNGLGGVFPAGLPVAHVVETERPSFGLSQRLEVRPSVAIGRLEEVLVIPFTNDVQNRSNGADEPEAMESN